VGLLKRFSGNPQVDKARAEFDGNRGEERFHRGSEGIDFTARREIAMLAANKGFQPEGTSLNHSKARLALTAALSMATSMSPLQEAFTLAAAFVILGVLAKFAARRENDVSLKRNELAISPSVSLMTLSKIFADLFAKNGNTSHPLFLAAVLGIVALFFFATLERYTSWHEPSVGPPRKKIWLGIIIPDILAISVLFLYYWLRCSALGP
jgi:hypothetical protein